jgi:hypothetical protein
MRKTLAVCAGLTAAFLIAIPAIARAQGGGGGGLALKGGLSYGNISNGGVFPGDNKQRTGAAIGLGINSGGGVGFGLEGLYAQRGITARKLDYIDVPAYLKLEITNPAIAPFGYLGPQVSFELKCDADAGTCPSGRPKTTYAGVAGAGVRLNALHGLSIEGRYIYGLTDLKLNTVTTSDSYKTRSFLVLFGIGM